ncbi:uncharacterized protein At1g05835-like [Tripterygium wilfordii]|uniref:uncharacterized protein At1g05835-like n=1 Tax=Tripterygium wilfordii TaxID=458696 RepID=UPI0018F81489|nr:uncharacterized protein At1g05835-like [Tripterygium wilfordii]
MASTLKFVCALFLLCLIEKDASCETNDVANSLDLVRPRIFVIFRYCQCKPGQFTIAQAKTGGYVSGKPEYSVTISNKCPCTQLDLTLSCHGFQSAKLVSELTKTGSTCLVNNGQPIYPQSTFTFTYSWDAAFPFKPLSSAVACS